MHVPRSTKHVLVAIVLVVVAAAVAVAIFWPKGASTIDIASDGAVVVPQTESTRRWLPTGTATTVYLDDVLGKPSNLRRYDDEMFLVDGADLTVKRFSFDGRLLGEIGEGRGQGPGELSSIADYAVRGDSVWVLDHRARKVSLYSRSGTYRSMFRVDCPCLRIAALDSAVVLLDLLKSTPFRLFTFEGEFMDSFGLSLADDPDNPFSLEGYMAVTSSGGLWYSPRYASYIVDLGSPERPRFIQLIDRQGLPSTDDERKPTGPIRFVAPDQPLTMFGLAVSGDTASVLSQWAPSPESAQRRIDRYLTGTGRYIGSIRLPDGARKSFTYGGDVYSLMDTLIVRMSLLQ